MLHLLLIGPGGDGDVLPSLDDELPPVLHDELHDDGLLAGPRGGELLAVLQGATRWGGSSCSFFNFLMFSFVSGAGDELHLVLHGLLDGGCDLCCPDVGVGHGDGGRGGGEPGGCSIIFLLLLLLVCSNRGNLLVRGAAAPPPVRVLAGDGGADGGFLLSFFIFSSNFLFFVSGCFDGSFPPDSGLGAGRLLQPRGGGGCGGGQSQYAMVTEYRCKFARNKKFQPCPWKLRVLFLSVWQAR